MQEQILVALRRGANDEALALARTQVDTRPDAAQSYRLLAMALQAGGERDAALAAVETAIGMAPEDPEAHFQRAVILGGTRDLEAARQALAEAIELDPNQFGAYVLQAQLALGRRDLDEAARLATLAGRLEPEHPWVLAIEGMVALGRGQDAAALALLSKAGERAPDDPQVLLPLSLVYIANGHQAFAEQALRKLVEDHGGALPWRVLLAETLARQRRPAEGLEVLAPALADADVPPALLRLAGELELAAGRADAALPWLRQALAALPHDTRAVVAAMTAWQRLGEQGDARSTLDGLLVAAPQSGVLWQARLSLEGEDIASARELVARWSVAMPEAPGVLEARMRLAMRSGEEDGALALAHELAARVPDSGPAHSLIVDVLQRRDPGAAVAHVSGLLEQAGSEQAREVLTTRLALLEDGAGRPADALGRWEALAALRAPSRLPLPPVSLPAQETAAGPWPEWSARGDGSEPLQTLFLWGPPGSCVENLASLLSGVRGFRADRLTARAPDDVFQRFDSIPGLSSAQLDPEQAAHGWRTGLQARDIDGANVIEWLVWWDNALLRVLRPHVPAAGLLFVLRDPRDMLLQWLAFGSPMQYAMPSVDEAAWWLERRLVQILEATSLYRVAVLRIDGSESDGPALAGLLSRAMGMEIVAGGRPLSRAHFAPGHWRRYADVLAGPFARLAPVARALGYPET